jgi:hypothetical protein
MTLPLHRYHLDFVRVDQAKMTLSSLEWGGVLRRWDPAIIVEWLDDDRAGCTEGS